MSFDVSDIVVDIHDINDLDNKNRRRRSGVITTINSIVAYVNINGTIEEIPVKHLLYKRIIT